MHAGCLFFSSPHAINSHLKLILWKIVSCVNKRDKYQPEPLIIHTLSGLVKAHVIINHEGCKLLINPIKAIIDFQYVTILRNLILQNCILHENYVKIHVECVSCYSDHQILNQSQPRLG